MWYEGLVSSVQLFPSSKGHSSHLHTKLLIQQDEVSTIKFSFRLAKKSVVHLITCCNHIENIKVFFAQAINGVEKGEPAAMLLSPTSYPTAPSNVDSSRHPSGSLFTSFLTAPLQAFCLLLGIPGSDIDTVSTSNIAIHT